MTFAAVPSSVFAEDSQAANRSPHDQLDQPTREFLSNHCLDCHSGESAEANFDLHALMSDAGLQLSKGDNLRRWTRVFDRVHDGEMPPEDYGDMPAAERAAFEKRMSRWLHDFVSQKQRRNGRVGARRLTNDQLERTLHDLLAIDVPLANLIPDETRIEGFRNIAESQSMSHYHLNDHLRVVDTALDAAWNRVTRRSDQRVIDFPPTRIANKPKGRRNRDPEMREGLAVVWKSTMAFYGRISNSRVRQAGRYRITVTASAVKPPKDRGVWCSVRSGQCSSNAPLMNWIGSFEATEEPTEHTFVAWIEDDHLLEIRPADATLKNARFKGGQVGFGEGEPQDVPGVAMHALRIERIHPGGTVDDVREKLFGDLSVLAESSRSFRQPRTLKLESDAPKQDLERQLRRFARSAFRLPITDELIAPYVESLHQAIDEGADPLGALKQSYRAVLCSPRFLYFTETPGRLDDHAIAARLSYLLTGSTPDSTLSRLADEGKLSDQKVLVKQVRRLLQSEHLDGFVEDFSDQWLDLADISFTEPDRKLFREFDLVVQNAMLGETRRFLTTMIRENRPVSQLVDADFTWLNSRLAEYYDIETKLAPTEWKLVSLTDHERRGGLMTHGSILKVTANGNDTSPVLRGVWICDRLLGIPIPDPPSNVPAIEPDTRGAKSIRDLLEKHRSDSQCASCHSKIDPPGFALEQFDPAGQWRDRYLTRSRRSGPPINPAYRMADGRRFESFSQFRKLAATDKENIAKNFAAKLLVYATGQQPTFADRKALDEIAAETRSANFPVRSLIEAVVTSDPFLNK